MLKSEFLYSVIETRVSGLIFLFFYVSKTINFQHDITSIFRKKEDSFNRIQSKIIINKEYVPDVDTGFTVYKPGHLGYVYVKYLKKKKKLLSGSVSQHVQTVSKFFLFFVFSVYRNEFLK